MKSVLLIGLGRFGKHMAERLIAEGNEVLAVDINEERVNDAIDMVTDAQIGDATNEHFVESLGVRNFDLCVVAIGDNFQRLSGSHSAFKGLRGFHGAGKSQPGRACKISFEKWCRRCSVSGKGNGTASGR